MFGDLHRDLARVLEVVPDPALAVDASGRIIAANTSATRLFGTISSPLPGRMIESLLPAASRERHAARRRGFQSSPTTRRMGEGRSFVALRGDGTPFDAEISLTPLDGPAPVVIAAVRDVSERLRLERSLRDRLAVEQVASRVASTLVGASGTDLDACITDGLREVARVVVADEAVLRVVDGATLVESHRWAAADTDRRIGGSSEEIPLGVGTDVGGALVLRWWDRSPGWNDDLTPLLQVLGDAFQSALRRRDVEESHREGEHRHQTVLASLAEAIVLLDHDGLVVEHNAAASRLLGLDRVGAGTQFPPPDWTIVDRDGDPVDTPSQLPWTVVRRTGTPTTDAVIGVRRIGRDLSWLSVNARPLEGDRTRGHVVVSLVDVTRSREMQRELSRLALQDPLTGLANRTLLHDRIEHDVAGARRDGAAIALLFADLDGFKEINDRDGHAVGDEVLRAVAERFHASVRPADTVARVGGDEFVVLARVDGPSRSVGLARRIISALHRPLDLPGQPTVGVSIGIAVVRPAEREHVAADDLLRWADQAMYRAKASGGDRWVVADPDLPDEQRFARRTATVEDPLPTGTAPGRGDRTG